jgi:hypothetical protein
MQPGANYRVVGVQADGSRRVLVDEVSNNVAILVLNLINKSFFTKIVIEQNETSEASLAADAS